MESFIMAKFPDGAAAVRDPRPKSPDPAVAKLDKLIAVISQNFNLPTSQQPLLEPKRAVPSPAEGKLDTLIGVIGKAFPDHDDRTSAPKPATPLREAACYRCNSPFHFVRECPEPPPKPRDRENQGVPMPRNYDPHSRSNSMNRTKAGQPICQLCGAPNHQALSCPKLSTAVALQTEKNA